MRPHLRQRRPGSASSARWLIVLLLLLAGCKSLPAIDTGEPAPARDVRVVTSNGAVVRRSSAGLAAAAPGTLLRHHLDFMETQGGPPLVAGNQARLLIDGPAAYHAMFQALEGATNHINIEVYIFQDDAVGRDLAELLERKQRAGVQVNLIYDSVGCISTPRALFDRLRASGVQVREFNPVGPGVFDLNHRDHRKITVVDGLVAYTGGINFSGVYARGSSAPRIDRDRTTEGWRDTQIEVRGPAVAEFQRLFLDTWHKLDGTDAAAVNYFPEAPAQGDKLVRVIGSAPGDKVNLIYVDLLSAIVHARRSIHITMAYFGPDRRTIKELARAARRGVDVTLILPGLSDWRVVLDAGRSHYGELLRAGVKIYERPDALLHAKSVVIDGVWSTIGSSNMDLRSFLHNNEVNAVVLGEEFGRQMEAMFAQDMEEAEHITPQAWKQRPSAQKMREWFSRWWAYWL